MKKFLSLMLILISALCLSSCGDKNEVPPCEECGKILSEGEGVSTPLGMWICEECSNIGVGGTTPPPFEPSPEEEAEATTAQIEETEEASEETKSGLIMEEAPEYDELDWGDFEVVG